MARAGLFLHQFHWRQPINSAQGNLQLFQSSKWWIARVENTAMEVVKEDFRLSRCFTQMRSHLCHKKNTLTKEKTAIANMIRAKDSLPQTE